MKNILLLVKYFIAAALILIMLLGFWSDAIITMAGIVCALITESFRPLLLVLVGLPCGLAGAIAIEALDYIAYKWSWKV